MNRKECGLFEYTSTWSSDIAGQSYSWNGISKRNLTDTRQEFWISSTAFIYVHFLFHVVYFMYILKQNNRKV